MPHRRRILSPRVYGLSKAVWQADLSLRTTWCGVVNLALHPSV